MVKQSVLLQTALTRIYHPRNPQDMFRVRVILDNGKQLSYIMSRAKDALHLVPEDGQLVIAPFSGKRKEGQKCEVVCVGVKTHDGSDTKWTLLTVPHIL